MPEQINITPVFQLAFWQVFFSGLFCFQTFQYNLLQNFCNSVTYSKNLKKSIKKETVTRLQNGYKLVTKPILVTKKFVTMLLHFTWLQKFLSNLLQGYKQFVTCNLLIINIIKIQSYIGYTVTKFFTLYTYNF